MEINESVYDHKKAGRSSQTAEQLNVLPENVDMLAQAVTELEHRLEGVLRHGDQDGSNTVGTPSEVLVPVADALRNANDRINYIRYQVRNVLDRLEL